MNIIVTCGPSYEPIDQVRRLTNFSTGKLGVTLSNALTDSGHDVLCLKGEGATFPGPVRARRLESFSTNDGLAARLEALGRSERVDGIFHAAALCDYRVDQVLSAGGAALSSAKFGTRDGQLRLVLAPTGKVLARMRGWFPEALIVGWKYELAGTRDDAFAKAWNQISECRIDGCVLNGAAYGAGFAVCQPGGEVASCADADALFGVLQGLLAARRAVPGAG